MTTTRGQITDISFILPFALSGKSVFTLKSTKTGNHITFRVRKADPKDLRKKRLWFVDVMVGSAFEYAIMVYSHESDGDNLKWKFTKRSKVKPVDGKIPPSIAAFNMVMKAAVSHDASVLSRIEFWHEGRCWKCSRPLTDPESIGRGVGPVCANKAGLV